MKILCTADWHIGKRLEIFSRLDEQKQILQEIIDIAENESADVVILAGDCFDTQNPSPEMARLFVSTVAKLSKGGERLVLVIAGNHDNPVFLSATEALASYVGVCIVAYPTQIPYLEENSNAWRVENSAEGMIEITFKKYKKTVRFLLSPFANAQRLKRDLGTENSDQKAWELLCKQWEQNISHEETTTNILVTHYFCLPESKDLYGQEMPVETEGERSIVGTIGGMSLSTVPKGIDFMVLGHIHKPMDLFSHNMTAFYTGSPLIYSLGESGQEKFVSMIELSRTKRHYRLPLPMLRDVKSIKFTNFDSIYQQLEEEKENYLVLIWEGDRYMQPEEQRKLRESHPYIMRIESHPKIVHDLPVFSSAESIAKQSTKELFQEYFIQKNSFEAPEDILSVFQECLSEEITNKSLEKKQGFLPKKLTLQGFYSYQEKTEIDFSDLETYQFFGIFGDTGSGKSAIIEAMILSLYYQVERLGGNGKLGTKGSGNFSRAYSIMNLASDELLLEFEFEIFHKSVKEDYKCRIHAKRSSKKPLEISPKRSVFQKMNNEWVALEDSPMGEILLGISYEDFRKTIVLQQRDFMSFLSAEPKDTIITLQNLFQLDRFDLEDSLKIISEANKSDLNAYSSKLQDLSVVSDEEFEALELELSNCHEQEPILSQGLLAMRQRLDLLNKQVEQRIRFEEVQKSLDSKKDQNVQFVQAKERNKFQILLDKEEELNHLSIDVQKLQFNEKSLQKQLQELELHFVELKKQEQELVQNKEKHDLEISTLEQGRDLLIEQQIKGVDPTIERQLNQWEVLNRQWIQLQTKSQSYEKQFENLESHQKSLDLLMQKDQKQEQEKSFAVVIQHLHEGESCPICGSDSHPNPFVPSNDYKDLQGEIHDSRTKIAQATQAKQSWQEIQTEIQQWSVESKALVEFDVLKKQYNEQEQNLKQVKSDLEKLETERSQVKNNSQRITQEFEQVTRERQQTEIQLSKFQSDISNINQRIDELNQTISLRQSEWKQKATELAYSKEKRAEIEQYPNIEVEKVERFFHEYHTLEAEFKILQSILVEISDDVNLADLEREIQEKDHVYKRLLENIGALSKQIELIKQNKKLQQVYRENLEICTLRHDKISVVEKLLKGKGFVYFIAQKYLFQLCHAANRRFLSFTQNQFELLSPELADKGKIMILDHLLGGQRRDLLTLSGGQSFQAALALALALADESGAGHRFFFIDEGFGSLDQGSLQLILDTLRELSLNEKRVVGIISHVQDMKDEVNAYWQVWKDVSKGSQLRLTIN